MSAPATTGVNEDLLRRALTYITEHPDEHDQGNWAVRTECGAACCLAGWTVLMTGHELDWDGLFADDVTTGEAIADVAERELGLPHLSGSDLFDGGNSLDDLWRIAAELTDGRVSRPVATTPTK